MLESIELLEKNQLMQKALSKLPDTVRKAIQWVVIEGKSLRKTGDAFGVSAMTVQRRVKRGLKQLADEIGQHQPWV